MADLRPFADAGDEGETFVAGDGGGEGGFHVGVGIFEGDGVVFDDTVGEDGAVAALEGDEVVGIELIDVFKDAFDVWAAVVAVNHNDAAIAGAGGGSIPTDIEDAIRSVEFAVSAQTHGADAGVFNAELFDREIARIVGGNDPFGDLSLGDGSFVNFGGFSLGIDGLDGGAGAAFLAAIIIVFPDAGLDKEDGEDEENKGDKDFFEAGAVDFKLRSVGKIVFRSLRLDRMKFE